MTDLWFAGADRPEPTRDNSVLYAQDLHGLWAVLACSAVFPEVREESDHLLSHYGANVEGLGYLLSTVPVSLSPALELWGTARDVPAADIGVGVPVLIMIDGVSQLALSWVFESSRAYATTFQGDHVTVIAPAHVALIELAQTEAPTTPPRGSLLASP